jgi:DMSO/TMAO reductase YedYZ heme-binding membrane subunit
MSAHIWWYLARGSGYVAWGLLTAAVVSGLLLSARLTKPTPGPAWTLDLHRFLGAAALTFTGLHLAGLVADSFVHFGAADMFVPFASGWRPGAVALGIGALYLLVAVEGTSLLMRRIPRRWWKRVHLSSYVAFWFASFHLVLAGTDAANPASRAIVALAMAAIVFLTLVRALDGTRRRRPAARRTPDRPEAHAGAAPRPVGHRPAA